MAEKKNIVANEEVSAETIVVNPDEVLAYVIKKEDGYHVMDLDGNLGDVCTKISSDGYLYLTPNAANRKVINFAKTEAFFAENPDGRIELKYKVTRTIGSAGPSLPNAKLISYLPEAEQEEYRAIIARAIAARDAEKNKPLTEKEKAEKALAKAKAKLEALKAQLAELESTEN